MMPHPLLSSLLLAAASIQVASAATAPALPPVVSVTPMNLVQQNPIILLRDGNYSLLINGVSYWSFADTGMTKANAAGQSFIDNSLSAATSLDASQGIALNRDQADSTGALVPFIPFTTQENNFDTTHDSTHCTAVAHCGASLAVWAQAIAYDPVSKNVIVPFAEIIRNGGIAGFPLVGAGLAVGQIRPNGYFDLKRPIQNPSSRTPTLMWSNHEQTFTDEAFVLDGMYYAYGNRNVFVTTEDVLARVPVAQLLDKSAWTYFAGNDVWSSNVADAAVVFDGSASGGSVYFNKYLGEWMAIYVGNFSNDVYYRVAAKPQGPWSDQALLFVGINGYQGNTDYCGRVHPEFSPDGGMTEYVSYVHASGAFGQNLPLVKVVFGKAQ